MLILDQSGIVLIVVIDFSFTCHEKDIHAKHKAYLQVFKAPDNCMVPHCDACGHSFSAL